VLTGAAIDPAGESTDPVEKMLKMSVFLLAMTHVVVTPRRYEWFTWLLTLCALYVGQEAYNAPRGAFMHGRLSGHVGGADFTDANVLAAHMLALMPFIGVRFLRGDGKAKQLCLVAGGFAANTIVMTRSRGGYLSALIGLIVALVLVRKGQRKRLWPLVALGALGALTLVDAGFMKRMDTLDAKDRQQDESVQGRLRYWGAGLRMVQDHPLGVGPGNFGARIGDYLPGEAGRDTHNTYIRCAAELGWPGIALFLGLIGNAFQTLTRHRRATADRPGFEDLAWHGFALQVALVMYIFGCIFVSCNYIEFLWWLLLLPATLDRVITNAVVERPGPH
jgi:O-antigen ligase